MRKSKQVKIKKAVKFKKRVSTHRKERERLALYKNIEKLRKAGYTIKSACNEFDVKWQTYYNWRQKYDNRK